MQTLQTQQASHAHARAALPVSLSLVSSPRDDMGFAAAHTASHACAAMQRQEELEAKLAASSEAHDALASALTQAQAQLAQLQEAKADLQRESERLQANLEQHLRQAADDKHAYEEHIDILTHAAQVHSVLICPACSAAVAGASVYHGTDKQQSSHNWAACRQVRW